MLKKHLIPSGGVLPVLHQPYPSEISRTKKAGLTAGISLFVFLFLVAFAPFGLDNLAIEPRIFTALGYGLSCAAAMAFNYYLVMPRLPTFFNEAQWTVGRQILWTGWILFTISIFNSILRIWLDPSSISWVQLGYSAMQVTLMGIFPVTAIVLLDYLRLLRKHAARADNLNTRLASRPAEGDETVVLAGDTNHERLQLKQHELLYLTSADNYVTVVYHYQSRPSSKLLRGTLKRFEKQLNSTVFVRCHRSYIVNLANVISVSGNAQGYTLTLRGADIAIPVSRTYADRVLSGMDQMDQVAIS